jgi:hypothetical protein
VAAVSIMGGGGGGGQGAVPHADTSCGQRLVLTRQLQPTHQPLSRQKLVS